MKSKSERRELCYLLRVCTEHQCPFLRIRQSIGENVSRVTFGKINKLTMHGPYRQFSSQQLRPSTHGIYAKHVI